jgi:hypothetical protein
VLAIRVGGDGDVRVAGDGINVHLTRWEGRDGVGILGLVVVVLLVLRRHWDLVACAVPHGVVLAGLRGVVVLVEMGSGPRLIVVVGGLRVGRCSNRLPLERW